MPRAGAMGPSVAAVFFDRLMTNLKNGDTARQYREMGTGPVGRNTAAASVLPKPRPERWTTGRQCTIED